MNRYPILVVFFSILIAACSPKNHKNPDYTVLKGATVFDGNGDIFSNSVLIIKDGKIASFGDQTIAIPENSEVMDVSGKYITPGLVDAHVHFSQTGFFDARPDALDIRDSIDFIELQSYLKRIRIVITKRIYDPG